jgi:hypothetical protein
MNTKTVDQIVSEGYKVAKVSPSSMYLNASLPVVIEEYCGKYGTGYKVYSLRPNNRTVRLTYYVK